MRYIVVVVGVGVVVGVVVLVFGYLQEPFLGEQLRVYRSARDDLITAVRTDRAWN